MSDLKYLIDGMLLDDTLTDEYRAEAIERHLVDLYSQQGTGSEDSLKAARFILKAHVALLKAKQEVADEERKTLHYHGYWIKCLQPEHYQTYFESEYLPGYVKSEDEGWKRARMDWVIKKKKHGYKDRL